MRTLWYEKSAKIWNEALPIGNGRIGAMVFGEPLFDRMQINEETLWSGSPTTDNTQYSAEFLQHVRDLTKNRKYDEAHDAIQSVMTGAETAAYIPYGYLNIDIISATSKVEAYRRELNLENATTSTRFILEGNKIEKTAFVSLTDDVLVYRIKSEKGVTLRVTSVCELQHTLTTSNGVIKTLGRCPTSLSVYNRKIDYDEDKESIAFCSMLKAVPVSGDITVYGGSSLRISGTDFMLIFSIKTSFNGYDKQPISQGKEYENACAECLEKACAYTYEQLLSRHEKEYKKYFDRVSFTLDGEDFDEPINERIKKAGAGRVDNKLVTLLFDYARFLAICSNGIGKQATNLQGIWNEELLPNWRCNYTVNINTQMNYWPMEAFNLPEMHKPLFQMLRDLKERGNPFGLRGWALFHNTDIWRDISLKSPYPMAGWWVTGGAWLCRHIWDHYEHTQDVKFLEENYDILVSHAEFLLDYMTEKEGKLIISPSTSPENSFIFNGKTCVIAEWTAMDQEICLDFFDKIIKISEILHKDCTLYRETFEKIMPVSIGSDGRIMEWNEEFEEEDPGHRHTSHIYGFHPADILTDKYADAVKKCIEVRIKHGNNSLNACGEIGWSCAWVACIYARLGDGEKFMQHMRKFFKNCTYDNLFSVCSIFQIDANFGIASAIIEALVQSHRGKTELLPAIPKEWTHGEVKGLIVRSGEKIDFKW